MGIISRIVNYYWIHVASPYKYAKHIGVSIGDNCLIATKGFSTEPYLVTIGNNVQLTVGCQIHTHGGGNCIREKHPDFDVFGKVEIQDWAYIGANSQILPGVTIGYGSLVAAGSIVTKSVPPYTVVAGNPAKIICTTEEYYNKNIEYDLKTKRLSPEKKKELLLSGRVKFIKK
ncbi:MAG: acyltransferase [Prevotella sp.]|nr:acyltransferase [Prevotella sp.]